MGAAYAAGRGHPSGVGKAREPLSGGTYRPRTSEYIGRFDFIQDIIESYLGVS